MRRTITTCNLGRQCNDYEKKKKVQLSKQPSVSRCNDMNYHIHKMMTARFVDSNICSCFVLFTFAALVFVCRTSQGRLR